MYAAPLCYVYNEPCVLYFVFRAMYTGFFHQLHTLSSHPKGIVSLCLLFETLLQTNEPALFLHLKSIGVQPLRLAFKWLVRAFSGYLASEQVKNLKCEKRKETFLTFLPRDALLSAVYAVVVCLCVCVSVTLRYCIKTAKRRITQTTPHDSPMTLVF